TCPRSLPLGGIVRPEGRNPRRDANAMSVADMTVLLNSLAAIVELAWFFFAPRQVHSVELTRGVQRVDVTVRGGYHPDLIRVKQGVPVELVFDRRESGECTSRVVFGDF